MKYDADEDDIGFNAIRMAVDGDTCLAVENEEGALAKHLLRV